MFIKRIIRPFRQLRGKLTLSYMLTSVVAALFLSSTVVGIGLLISSLNTSYFVLNYLQQEAPQATPYFVHTTPDRDELTVWLQNVNNNAPNSQGPFHFAHPIFLSTINTQGRIIASVGIHPIPVGTLLQAQLSPQSQANLQAVLRDSKGKTGKVKAEADNTLVAEAPIMGPKGNIEGALVMKIAQPDKLQLVSDFLSFILVVVIIFTVISAIVGLIFGSLTSRGLTRRLKRLSAAADRWSHGDFSALTYDTSEDELGQVARQFNRMAEQIQNLLQARQKLATLEERNRLARDLHDSIKQQIFAVVMQIGATRLLLKRDSNAAEQQLLKTEQLVKQAQQELTALIRELRPVALEGKGLVVALRELTTQWAQQTDIIANLRAEDTQTLTLTVEEALFRIAQEALSNVARHSKATLVQMLLTMTDDIVTLSIIDNGQGFDKAHQWHLGVGLLSMQERMKALGGDIQIESAPGKGTQIIACCKCLGIDTGALPATTRDENANAVT